MMNAADVQKITDEVKSKLRITWDDEETKKELKRIVEDAEATLNFVLGAEMNYSTPGLHRSLFVNYCMYDYNNCLPEFYTAYKQDIQLVKAQNEVLENATTEDTESE